MTMMMMMIPKSMTTRQLEAFRLIGGNDSCMVSLSSSIDRYEMINVNGVWHGVRTLNPYVEVAGYVTAPVSGDCLDVI